MAPAGGGSTARLKDRISAADTRILARLDDTLHGLWRYGRNMMLAWCEADSVISILVVPNYLPAEMLSAGNTGVSAATERGRAVQELIDGRKQVAPQRMRALASLLGITPHRISLNTTFRLPQSWAVEEIVGRYSISRFDDRAVVLFDIVGFSLVDPLAQLTQLNSLAYSINVAHERLRQRMVNIEIARTTTGDGYYVWNRNSGIEANINLYHFMHLVLADNAIERAKSRPGLVPALKTAYHIGSHYEFFQAEALRPTRYSYIVGDVTIQIARLMDRALPGQVLVGEFNVMMPVAENSATRFRMDAATFIGRLQDRLGVVQGMVLSGERVITIKCYLTGPRESDGRYGVTRYLIADKHGLKHAAYNAKINIFRESGQPIFLGLQEIELDAQGWGREDRPPSFPH
jgi:class 3 adenylate cyclase